HNLALLCQAHHDVIHAGQWQMRTIKDKPWFVPPAWLDPQQRPVRNTLHDATNKAIRTGQQLRLNLERDQN
ncbi:MAG: hypothetical protein ACLGIA_05590, partial [Actinomycetes bacterium]